MSFEHLTPDVALGAVEQASGLHLTNLMAALPSYINRVYELRAQDGAKLIAKFYRPGRWSREAILEEHQFVIDCQEAEIPVVTPLRLLDGSTLGTLDTILFALFEKRSGRQIEMDSETMWGRMGSLLARLHICGEKRKASTRITLDPHVSTKMHFDYLSSTIPQPYRNSYHSVVQRIIEISSPLFNSRNYIRIHGDCHRGNILDRLEQGLLIIDFDDMAMGMPVQDLWMLLPDRVSGSTMEIDHFCRGYEQFRSFDRTSLRCIEPLRAMRMIHFLAWCSRQVEDYQFKKNFPDWGSNSFWRREINDLQEQLGFIEETIS